MLQKLDLIGIKYEAHCVPEATGVHPHTTTPEGEGELCDEQQHLPDRTVTRCGQISPLLSILI